MGIINTANAHKTSTLVSSQVPDFVQADHPLFVQFIESYYEFLKKREKGGNVFTELTNEPINYPSNVKGGFGFFNTHFPDVEYFDLNEF